MKKNFLIILFVVATATVCSTNITMEFKKGVYVVKNDSLKGAPSAISVELKSISYMDYFSEAISNPGAPVLVGQIEKIRQLKPVFKKLVETEERFIVYNDATKIMSYVESKKTTEKPSYIILFSVTSIILMIMSSILLKKEYYVFFVVVIFAAAFAAIYAGAVSAEFSLAATVFAFAAAAVFFFGACVLEDDKYYNKIFIILMAMHMVSLYI